MEKKILSKRDVGDGIQTTIQLSNTDKSKITTEEIGEIVNKFQQVVIRSWFVVLILKDGKQ